MNIEYNRVVKRKKVSMYFWKKTLLEIVILFIQINPIYVDKRSISSVFLSRQPTF